MDGSNPPKSNKGVHVVRSNVRFSRSALLLTTTATALACERGNAIDAQALAEIDAARTAF
jgi:hypothetical protein